MPRYLLLSQGAAVNGRMFLDFLPRKIRPCFEPRTPLIFPHDKQFPILDKNG